MQGTWVQSLVKGTKIPHSPGNEVCIATTEPTRVTRGSNLVWRSEKLTWEGDIELQSWRNAEGRESRGQEMRKTVYLEATGAGRPWESWTWFCGGHGKTAWGSVTGWLVPQVPLSATTSSMQRDREKWLERHWGGKKDGISDHGIDWGGKYRSKVRVIPVANRIGVDRRMVVSCAGLLSSLSASLSLSLSDHSLWEKSTMQSSNGKEPKLPDNSLPKELGSTSSLLGPFWWLQPSAATCLQPSKSPLSQNHPDKLLPDPWPLETRQDNKSCCLAPLNLFHSTKWLIQNICELDDL